MKILFAMKSINIPAVSTSAIPHANWVPGGAERVLAAVSNSLSQRGHEVCLLSYDTPGGQSYYPLSADIQRITLDIGQAGQPASLKETLLRMLSARKAVKKQAPDVIIAFMPSMFIPLGLAVRGLGIPLIASEHSVPAQYATRPLQKVLLYLTPFIAAKTTCVSRQVLDSYTLFLRKNMTVVPNPVAMQQKGRADVLAAQKARKIVLSVGRLGEEKNHTILIAAFALIAAEVPEWDVRIAGSGKLLPALRQQIEALGMADRIFLPGNVKKIEEEYRNAQLYVMPSLYESFGLSVAEALSFGLPVIGMGFCQGVNELVRPDYNGLLVENQENPVPELAHKLKTLMLDGEKRQQLSQNTAQALPQHHIDTVTDCWEQLITEVTGA